MVQEWLANGVFLYLMAGVCGAAVILKLLLANYYERQLRQTMRMNEARKKWLLLMRQEYEECMEAHGRVNNVDIFVDKYVEGKKFMGIMLSTWDKIGGQAWVLCAGLLVVAAVSGIFYQVDREAILFTFFIGIWTVIVDIVVDNIANLAEKRKQLKRNLVDYFDNHAWDGVESEGQGTFAEAGDYWENAVFSKEEAEAAGQEEEFSRPDFARKDFSEGNFSGEKFSAENMSGRDFPEERTGMMQDAPAGTRQAAYFVKGQEAAQGEELPEEVWAREEGRSQAGAGQPPKFYVVGGKEKAAWEAEQQKKAQFAAQERDMEGPEAQAPSTKKARRESKKEMAARKKREHMKYELKREMAQDGAAQAESLPPEKKAPSREAIEQLAAAIDLLKKENALEDAAPLLAAQISRDQENGALIEEVLREFLV